MLRKKSLLEKSIICAVLLATFLSTSSSVVAQLVCQIPSAPIVQTGSLTAGDPTQAGRINRNGIPGSCPVGKTNTLFNASAVVRDDYTFNSPITGCATIDFDARQCGGATTQAVVYSTYNPAAPGTNVISDFGFSTTGVASFGFPVTMGQNYTVVIHDILESPTNAFCTNYTFTITYRTNCRSAGFDQTNDGMADPVVFRPSTAEWLTLNSAGGTLTQHFGLSNDILTPGDYTGDGATDVSVYRPAGNTWYYGNNTTNPGTDFTATPWGVAGDVPVQGDYDGDGRTDIAIWRPSNGIWYALRSSDMTVSYTKWGQSGDIPVVADFDGDLKTDFAVVRQNAPGFGTNYLWMILHSNFDLGFAIAARWGSNGDVIVPGDYDGNGKDDITVYRPSNGTWYSIQSNAINAVGTTTSGFHWGVSEDIPQPADYDGDLTTDYAVFRPSNGVWYLHNSDTNTFTAHSWGTSTDRPVTAAKAVMP